MTTLTDGELWQQTRRGEPAALGELYERHARSVHRYCLWRTVAKHLAEDVTATAFLEAWRRRRRLEPATESAAPLLVLGLLAWGGLSHAETASALGIPIETVRAHAARRSSCLGSSVAAAVPLLLPDAATLAARRPVLEASCSGSRGRLAPWRRMQPRASAER